MPVKVTLQDGTEIEVPSVRREIKSREIGAHQRPSQYIDEPAPHPEYDFTGVIGGWLARPKQH